MSKTVDLMTILSIGQQSRYCDGSYHTEIRCSECNERVKVAKNDVVYSRNDPDRQKEDFVVDWLEMNCGHSKFYVKLEKDRILKGIKLSDEINLEELRDHDDFIFLKIRDKMTLKEILDVFKDVIDQEDSND